MSEIVAIQALSKTYHDGDQIVPVLKHIDLSLQRGETVAIMGRSGSGKSTLLNLIGGLDQPSGGTVYLEGESLYDLKAQALCQLRNRSLGFIYQFHHLLPEFTALENVAMPLLIQRMPIAIAMQQAHLILSRLGLADRLEHKPSALSGGERQRVAIARAMVHNPSLILADEPTGNLDASTANQVLSVLLRSAKDNATGLIMVTHDESIAKRLDKRFSLQSGQLLPLG